MDEGSKEPFQVIKFDYPEPPTKHRWELIEGSEQDLLPYQRDPDHGRILRIKAEQDFCMDYHVGMLQQTCKAIGFVVRSESDFAFYAEVKVRFTTGHFLLGKASGTPRGWGDTHSRSAQASSSRVGKDSGHSGQCDE